MHWQYTPYALPLIIGAAISAALAFYVWRRRPASGATSLALLMLAVAGWSLGYALELGSVDLPLKVFWARVEYLGIATVPMAWLVFALQHTGRAKWLTRRNLALLAIVPFATLLLVWTNDIHGLIWSTIALDSSGSFSMLDLSYGPWFWVHIAYSYLLLSLGTLLLIQTLIRAPRLYRGQAAALLSGALAPWVGNALYITELSPLDLTPLAFTLTGLAAIWGLFRFRLLDVVPVARDAVIEGMSDGVIVLDAQNRIVDLNPAAQAIIGRPAAEVIGQAAAQILSAWPDLIERYRDVTEARAEIVLGEGEAQRYYDLRISPLYNRRGYRAGRLVVLRDIAERKQAEEALQESEERYRDLFENANDLIQSVAPDGSLIYVNRAWRETLGYSPEEIPGLSLFDIIHPHSKAHCMEMFQRVMAGEQFEHIEAMFVTKDGRTVAVEGSVNCNFKDGQPIATRGIFRDITERKRTEKELEKSFSLLRATLESTADGILVLDREGNIVTFNRKFVDMWRIPDAIRMSPDTNQAMMFVAEQLKDPTGFLTKVQEWHAQPAAESHDLLEFKDGRIFEYYSQSQRIGAEGFGRVFSFRDITERVAAQEALKKRAEELELLNVKLTESESNLRESNAAKDKFFSIISHDLRNPFTSLLGFSQILADNIDTLNKETIKNFSQNMYDSTTRLFDLLENLLQWSRVQTGRIEYQPKKFELQEIVNNNVHLLIDNAAKKGVNLLYKIEENVFVYVDQNMINSVIQNLISNAVKFTNAGGEVKVTSNSKDDFIELSVSDTGVGMSAEEVNKLFRIDVQHTTHGTAGETGTGLGLVLCKEFVEKHGGQIWVESKPGVGTSVKFTLPKAR